MPLLVEGQVRQPQKWEFGTDDDPRAQGFQRLREPQRASRPKNFVLSVISKRNMNGCSGITHLHWYWIIAE